MSHTQLNVSQPLPLSALAAKLIGTQIVELTEKDKIEIKEKTKELQTSTPIVGHLWNSRTNQPYKNIINEPENVKKFFNGENAVENFKEKDIIVHTVQESEKKETDVKLKELKGEILDHNNYLKKIYSTEEKESHFKQFERSKIFGEQINVESHEKKKEDIKTALEKSLKDTNEGKVLIDESKKLLSQLLNSRNTTVIDSDNTPVSSARNILYRPQREKISHTTENNKLDTAENNQKLTYEQLQLIAKERRKTSHPSNEVTNNSLSNQLIHQNIQQQKTSRNRINIDSITKENTNTIIQKINFSTGGSQTSVINVSHQREKKKETTPMFVTFK